VITLLGIVGGIWLYSPSKGYRFRSKPSSVPFKGQKRWHVILGFVFGLAAFTWIFSGMWSMSPLQAEPDAVETQVWQAVRESVDLSNLPEFDKRSPQWALGQIASQLQPRELEMIKIGGVYAYLASKTTTETALLRLNGELTRAVSKNVIEDAVNRAVGPYSVAESRVVTSYETYYVDRHHEIPLPALYLKLNDPRRCFFYFNLRDGALVSSYGRSAQWDRWLYSGLHSLDLPVLYKARPLWDVLVIGFMLGGIALSGTACVLALRRLNRKLVRPFRRWKAKRAPWF
jgi:hypothetical protein